MVILCADEGGMAMRKRWMGRSRVLAAIGVICLGFVGVAIPAGQASAKPGSTGETATSPFKYLSEDCGYGPATDVIGNVVFTRTSSTLSISITLRGAPANSSFYMELWGYDCTELEALGTVHVNASGDATASFHVEIAPVWTNFFLAAPNELSPYWSETNDVYLPGPPPPPVQTSPFKYNSDDCGFEPGSSIGTVVFTHTGSRLSILVTLHGPAYTTYPMELNWGYECEEIDFLGYVTTNAHGLGLGSYTVSLPSYVTSVFLSAYTGVWNESNNVFLAYTGGGGDG
jgi:hypothetical protein